MLAMTDKCCLARVSPNTVFYAALLSCATADVLCTDGQYVVRLSQLYNVY